MQKQQIISHVLVGVAGLGVGSGVTFLVLKKRLEAKYQAITESEIESVKHTYRLIRKEGLLSTVEGAAEHLKDLEEKKTEVDDEIKEYTEGIENLGYKQVTSEDMVDNTPEGGRVSGIRGLDYDVEVLAPVAEVQESRPYIIREDEYHNGHEGYSQYSYTYYVEDSTLAGEDERAVEDIDKVIGADSITKFGVGSNDADIVYVRNPVLLEDYEVTRDSRSYGVMVLGFDKTDGQQGVRLQADG
jgi:hypothetical protein